METLLILIPVSALAIMLFIIWKTGRKNAGYHPYRNAEVYRNRLFHELAKRN